MAERVNEMDGGAGEPVGNGAQNPGVAQLDPQAWFQWMQSVGGSRGNDFARMNKDFISLGGYQFDGKGEAVQANEWIRKCEQVFRVMDVSSVVKRQLAVQNLIGPALLWWRALEDGLDLTTFFWEQFRERLLARFVSRAAVSRLAKEFLDLKQGDLSVTEYVTRFNELALYAPLLVSTESARNDRFIQGLKGSIGMNLIPHEEESFDRVLDLALRYEYREELNARENSDGDNMFVALGRQLVEEPRAVTPLASIPGSFGGTSYGVCFNCGVVGHTVRRCPLPNRLVGKCYRCGSEGHRSRDCPQ